MTQIEIGDFSIFELELKLLFLVVINIFDKISQMLEPTKFIKSRLITGDDEESQVDGPKFNKSAFYCQTTISGNSPKESMMRKYSENDTSSQQLDDQSSIKISYLLEGERQRVNQFKLDTIKLKNELCSSQALNHQLESEKAKLLQEIRIMKGNYLNLQNQKINFIQQISQRKQEIDIQTATQKINEEKIQKLDWEFRKAHDEVNFQKTIESDLRKQNLLLKNKLLTLVQVQSENVGINKKLNEAGEINTLMMEKLRRLLAQMKQMKEEMRQHERKALENQEIKDRLFFSYEQLKRENQTIKNNSQMVISELKEKIAMLEQTRDTKNTRQTSYTKVISEQQQKINLLIQETINLTRKNNSLLDEVDYYQKKQQISYKVQIPLHTNSSYLTKIIKEGHEEMREMKEKLNEKEDEISQLKNTINLNVQSLKSKDQEIQGIKKVNQCQNKAEELIKQNQITELKQQNKSLHRKANEMGEKNKKLQQEMAEKDRIIMCYVSGKKSQKL